MAKITLTTVTNGQDISNINANFSALASALNLNVLYRKNIAGEDNTMQNDLDFNGYRAYNLADVLVNGISVTTVATNAQNAANSASASAGAALASQVASASSQAAAAQSAIDAANAAGAAGSLIAVNNLSDVPNKVTARLNLGLDQVNNTSDAAKPVSTATQTALNLKLDSATAVSTYLSQTNAASTYATITNLGLKAPLASAATTGTWTFAGLITPTSSIGIKGTVAGDNAQAGSIGEYLTNTVSGTGLTSGVVGNASILSLSAGDWDVWGSVKFIPAATTTVGQLLLGVTTTSATIPSDPNVYSLTLSFPTGVAQLFSTPVQRINVSAGATVWIAVYASFGVSTMTVNGTINARRCR